MDHNLLVSELQALIVESRRRHPDVKDASEHALELLKGGPVPRAALASHSDELLNPITLGCRTKVAKIVGISIAALQRLVSLGGVPTPALPAVLQTLASVAGQAVDIQLKILQALLSILTHNKDVHEDTLGNALLLCFKLQESRVSVVSSTAAATLRQAVMLVYDRLPPDTGPTDIPLHLSSEPPQELTVSASAMDAFGILSDLCLHTSASAGGGSLWEGGEKEKPRILKLAGLQRTFGLELIESILGGYEQDIKQRPELLFLIQHSLAPLLLRLQAEKPSFPIALRICRLIFLLIRFYSTQLPAEVETFLILLLRIGTGDAEGEDAGKRETIPPYQRILALEIMRGISGDAGLLQTVFQLYDERDPPNPKVFARLVFALSHLLSEKPALLGANPDIHGIGLPSEAHNSSGYFDMGLGMVSAAASVGVLTVSSMIGSTGSGMGQQSSLKQRLIEQHDKSEAPSAPETYPYLLALHSLIAVAEGIYRTAAQEAEALDTVRAMADSAWPALLAAFSFSIATNLSDQLFAQVLSAIQDFTIACGLLGLESPRHAFLSTLGKYAVPPPVVSAMQSHTEGTPHRGATGVEALGLTSLGVGVPTGPPSLSDRNLACLKSVVTIARALSATLDDSWHDVLEVLQNANFIFSRRPTPSRRPATNMPHTPTKSRPSVEGDRPDAFADLDPDSIQANVNALFDGTRDLDDQAFSTFIAALCKLSSAMMGIDPDPHGWGDSSDSSVPSTPKSPSFMLSPDGGEPRRRASGLQVSSSMKSSERSFSLTKLRVVATLNLGRLVNNDPAVGWDAITKHLLSVARHPTAASAIRTQATDTLGELLLAAMRIGRESRIQHQVFDVLVHQVDVQPISNNPMTDYEVRSSGFITLNKLLESSGHSLEVGWQTIFDMLNSVCREVPAGIRRTSSSSSVSSVQTTRPSVIVKGNANLVGIAFPSINLVCTDFLSSLDPDAMRSCIACLGRFASQKEVVNISLAAIGLMWNVSDAVQGSSMDLWLYLLAELLDLSRDDRLEVRSSAMQTLFRCLELYGSGLDASSWRKILNDIVFPLLDTARADESQSLALMSVGSIFSSFLPELSKMSDFDAFYRRLLAIFLRTFTVEHRSCCAAALKALERILLSNDLLRSTRLQAGAAVLDATWRSFVDMAASLESPEPFTQETLVVYVKIATLLHSQMQWQAAQLAQLSDILRMVMSYSRSPEYRLDIDMMSPLQQAIAELIGNSRRLGSSIVLSDLAEYTSLAFASEGSGPGRLTYVALAKYAMHRSGQVFRQASSKNETQIYTNGTIEAVLGALLIPIKLKYDCPAPSKFGNDPPLWKTALSTAAGLIEPVLTALDSQDVPPDHFEATWTLIVEIFAGVLLAEASDAQGTLADDEQYILPMLAGISSSISPRLGSDKVPGHLSHRFAETLRKASVLYLREHGSAGGTTAPVVPYEQEKMRYWALETLISSSGASTSSGKGKQKETAASVARACLEALMERATVTLREFLDDARLRGQLPFPRIREEELMFVLRHFVTLRVSPNTLPVHEEAPLLRAVSQQSPRAHLFRLYPLLLELSFASMPMPTIWIFPDEHQKLFQPGPGQTDASADSNSEKTADLDAGDGGDLIEVSGRDLARRGLELIGEEFGLSGNGPTDR